MSKTMALIFGACLLVTTSVVAQELGAGIWLGTWAASPQPQKKEFSIENQTLRQILRISQGGIGLRLRLSNQFGSQPLALDSVHVGLHGVGANIVPGTDHLVTFKGESNVTIPAYSELTSDEVVFNVTALSELAVSIFVKSSVSPGTDHVVASATNYISVPGNFADYVSFPVQDTTDSWFLISGVDVLSNQGQTLVTIGDSITDGVCSDTDKNGRWPDYLANQLVSLHWGVLNQGIGSNRVLTDTVWADQPSDSAMARFQRDVLNRAGVKSVILLEGINDIGAMDPGSNVQQQVEAMKTGYRQLIQMAHTAGVQIIVGTLTPIGGASMDVPARRLIRTALNNWFKTGHEFDAVIDFEDAVRDPNHPDRFLSNYDCGDHLHPNSRGYQAMAAAVPVSWFIR
jgi:lysophospholipase L1-like esterase